MKKSMKKSILASFLVVAILAGTSSSIAFAAENNSPISNSSFSISAERAISNNQIYSVIQANYESDESCPWNSDTQIKEIISTYDADNNVTGAIINLSTNEKDTGYMVYDLLGGQPALMQFGYDETYSIQGQPVTKTSKLGKQKLIRLGLDSYVIKEGKDYYTIDNQNITDKKTEIQQIINKDKIQATAYVNEMLSKSERSSLVSNDQVIYDNQNVTNLFTSGYTPVHLLMYTSDRNKGWCSPICGTNMLKYWTVCRGVSNLLYPQSGGVEGAKTVELLVKTMKFDPKTNQVLFGNDYSGLKEYCSTYGRPTPVGNSRKSGFDWNWATTQIKNGNPINLSASLEHFEGDIRTGYHAFFAVGYQNTSTGNFLRVCNQWDNSLSHFYDVGRYASQVDNMWYYRWA